MSEPAPINADVRLRGVYLKWRAVNGPIPIELQAADGASTSTTRLPTGDLLLKRGYLGPVALAEIMRQAAGGRITAADVLTPEQARALIDAMDEGTP